MKKVVSILMIYSVAFMGFATTPQGVSLNAYASNGTQNFDALPFGTELGAEELAQVEGEWRRKAVEYGIKAVKVVARATRDSVIYQKGVEPAAKSANKSLT